MALRVKNIIGPFKRAATHTHPVGVGTDATPHAHEFDVKLTFQSKNNKGIALVYSPVTQKEIEDCLDGFFKGNFSGITCEEMCQSLFKTVHEMSERIKAKHSLIHDYELAGVSATVVYDGTLDHPTGPVEYVVERGPEP
jgi:hypothetical protein